MSDLITVTVLDRVAHVTLRRPEVRNALNLALLQQLEAAFRNISAASDISVVLLYGEGNEAFSAGADLKELCSQATLAKRTSFFLALAKALTAMERCPKPVVVKVHGHALAGGCGIVAAADIVLAAEDARFGLPEVHVGLAAMTVMAPVVRAIGHRAATLLTLTGRQISAQEAFRIGLVSEIHSKDTLDKAAVETARSLAKKGPVALAEAKRALIKVHQIPYAKALKDFAVQGAKLSVGAEAIEGIRAFVEKRPPVWPTSSRKKGKVRRR